MNPPNYADLYRGLGEVEGRLGAMEDRLNKMDGTLDRIDGRLARIEESESKRKGAFALGHWLVGAISGLVAFAAAHFLK